MIELPDRLGALIKRIEAGDLVTQKDVDKIAALQSLDLARAGRDFVNKQLQSEAAEIENLRKVLEGA